MKQIEGGISRVSSVLIAETAVAIPSATEPAREAALALQSVLTKPAGALGRLEELHVWAAGLLGEAAPRLDRKTIVVAAADHLVTAEGVSAYPSDVTAQMVRNFLDGGAAISVLAAHAGARVRVVDAGVASDVDDPRLHIAQTQRGAANITHGPAMSREEAETLIVRGIDFARDECASGARAIGLGDMGIGNTTAAAAIASVLCGVPAPLVTGRGTGIDDATYEAKVGAVQRAIAVNEPDPQDPLDVLAKVGGCEIAFLAGVALGAASARAIVVLDGYPTTAAALIAARIAPPAVEFMLASHLSAEPGHRVVLDELARIDGVWCGGEHLRPALDLGLRLGEGTGAALAMSILDAALRIPREMATFESAKVSRSERELRPER
jgi:nicotinate-nucleotide--dimethylbenzimidazole phosphoribosyltransferase